MATTGETTMDSTAVRSLDARVQALERALGGPKLSATVEGDIQVVKKQLDRLSANEQLKATLTQLDEIYSATDPGKIADATMPLSAKLEAVLACYDTLQERAQNMEQLSALNEHVNPPEFRDIPRHMEALAPIYQVHTQQQEASATLGHELDACLAQYNQLITNLSEVFVQWDQAISQLEGAKGAR
eukprot:comp93518_c0_seq1/m.48631 comp93518_c0_seq1/g.48631  ORF comp93518_c0_seq1/g.48631 comp93518_c0_seq1/m.48631 type:complete len:186 (-) comp93518_c0_seq1:329-886(-)